jgi:hypothetical protein
MVLLLLPGAPPPSCLKAQTTESHTFSTNCPAPDGNAAGLGDVRHVDSTITKATPDKAAADRGGKGKQRLKAER